MRVEERLLRYFQWKVYGLVDSGPGESAGHSKRSELNVTPDAPGWLMSMIDVGIAIDKLSPPLKRVIVRRWRAAVEVDERLIQWAIKGEGCEDAARGALKRMRQAERRREYDQAMVQLNHLLGGR